MSKAIKAGFGYVIGNYLLKGLVFLTIPIFARLLSPSDYGTYNTFVAYESIGSILLGLAIHSSYKNAKYKYDDKNRGLSLFDSYVSATMFFLLTMSLMWFAVFFLLADNLSQYLGLEAKVFYLLIPYCLGNAVIMCFNSYMGLQYKFKNYLAIAATNAILSIVLSIVLIKTVFQVHAYWGRIIGTTAPIFAIGLFIIVFFVKKTRPMKMKESLGWGIRYSLPIVPHGLSQIILSQFDRIMIFRMIGTAEAGIYSFGYNIYMIFYVTISSLDNVWGPWFYEKRNAGNYSLIRSTSTWYVLFMAFFAAVLVLVSPELVKILAPSSYYEGVYSVIPVVGAGFFVFLYNIPASVEYFHEKTKYIAVGTMSAALLNIVLNLCFIPRFGYVAAAYTTLATYIVYFGFHYLMAGKIEGKSLFDTKIIVVISTGVLVVVAGTRLLIGEPAVRWTLAAILGLLLVYFEERKFCFIKKKMGKNKKC